jgi:hypothetical protein
VSKNGETEMDFNFLTQDHLMYGLPDDYLTGTYIQGVPGGNVPEFGRMFLKLKYTDITKNTYIQS